MKSKTVRRSKLSSNTYYSQAISICSLLLCAFVLHQYVQAERLSTVFVLETSDSSLEAPSSVGEASATSKRDADETNTKIITDEPKLTERMIHENERTTRSPVNHQSQIQDHNNNYDHAHTDTNTHSHINPTQTNHQHQHQQQPQPKQTTNPPANAPLREPPAEQKHHQAAPVVHNQLSQQHNSDDHHDDVVTQHNTHANDATSQNPKNNSNKNSEQAQHQETSRRLNDDELHPKALPVVRSVVNQQRPKNTGSQPYEDHSGDGHSVPKTEDRLLISISSSEDEYSGSDYSKPPLKQQLGAGSNIHIGSASVSSSSSSSSSSGYTDQNGHHQPDKRKPSITISIQNANIGKHTGSPSSPAVIVRPSENGQSIVISTVGVGEPHSNKYNPNGSSNQKPTIAIVSAGGHSNDSPYLNEPSTTRRPTMLGGSNNNNPNINSNNPYNPKPVTTLLDPPDEKPSRPQVISNGQSGGTESSIYGAPVSRPTTRSPLISNNNNDNSNYDGINSNNNPINDNHGDSSSHEDSAGSSGQQSKYPLNERNCGLVHETKIVGGEEANPDDFLWMAAIVKSRPKDGDPRPFCGGSLITRRHILTAAHCLENLAPRDVLVRLGSYDFEDATASASSADFAIDQFRVPGSYSKKTHAADIAIMRLKTPLSPNDHYKTVCMPQPRRSYVGALGKVTGYGSQSQTFRKAAPKLRQVTVPVWENRKCSVVYKKNLTESFLCAGYEEGGKDACQGDSGGPLMTDGPNERMMVIGVVSHGIGCGAPGYPGVYTRTTTYLDWIEKNTRE